MVDRAGTVVKDQNGKIRYSPIIEFRSKEIRDKFSENVIAALHSSHPEALLQEDRAA
jgi:hypothetical protein